MDGLDKAYVSLPELSQLSGLSLSTLRRRVKDGSIKVVQPGGPRTRVLCRRDVLERLVPGTGSIGQRIDTDHGDTAIGTFPSSTTSHIPGPRPKWLTGA